MTPADRALAGRDSESGRWWLKVAAPAAVLAVALLPFWGLWRAPGPPMEEGFMLVFPELVLRGEIPNRDFLHLYGPGSLWMLAGVYRIFGVALEVERAVAFVQQLGVAFGVFVAIRPWGRWVAAAGASVAAVIVIPPVGLTALAWPAAVALGLWAIHAALRAADASPPARDRLFVLAGLGAAASLLFRPDLVVGLGLSGVVLLRVVRTRRDRVRLLAGLGGGLALYVVHVAMAGPRAVFNGILVEPVFKLRGGRRLPLPPSWDHFDGFLQLAGDTVAPPWPLPAPPSPAQLSLWIVLIVVTLIVLVTGGMLASRRGDKRLLVFAVFAVGLLPQALQRADSAHLAWVSCVPLGLLPAAIIELRRAKVSPSPRFVLAAALAPALLTLAIVPHFTWRTYGDYTAQSVGLHREVHTISHNGRRFFYGRKDAVDAVHALLRDVEQVAEPGDRLFVGTGDLRKTPYSEAFLYYLLPELPPATRYIEMDPGVANASDSGLARDLASADVVILSSIRDDWDEPNDSRLFGDDGPNAVLAETFCLVSSHGVGLFGRGLYELYVRC
ncbi:MAG: hypothetical protein ACR2H3_14010 [Acidimicrobiales bacterium]